MSDRAVTTSSEKSRGARAMHWGVMTWIGNGAGCLVGMIPIALPVSIALTVITLLTGIWAMALGAGGVGKRASTMSQEERRAASIGFWLGAAHVVIVVVFAAILVMGLRHGWLEQLGLR